MSDADPAADGAEAVTPVDGTDESVKQSRPCPYCGASMVHRHCEYVCPRHGVVFDCSDPFYG